MKFNIRTTVLVSTSILVGLMIGLMATVYANKDDNDKEKAVKSLPLQDLRTFTEVMNRIKVAYVEPVDDATLLGYAIEGMLAGLDPHSAYLRPKDFEDLQISTTGQFGGLGIEVTMEDGFVKVVTPIDDTPAQKAGVEAGDLVIKLDGESVKGMSLIEAVNIMRGKPGTDINLTIVREGETGPLEIVITRDVIKVKSVKTEALEKGYGYIRVTQFQLKTGPEIHKLVKKMQKEHEPLKGLILDLRNNPGGVLQAAVDVADAFLNESGLIVYTKGRIANSELSFSATSGDVSEGIPIVVLINGGSASASEIVAGALQDHSRAIIMGTDSFGKGSVQTVLPLQNDRAVKLTTALYYTPNGRSIQAQGIEPDIKLEPLKVTKVDRAERLFRESDLRGHLSNGNGDKEDKTKAQKGVKNSKSKAPTDKDNKKLVDKDYQIYEALNLLKAMNIIGQRKNKINLKVAER